MEFDLLYSKYPVIESEELVLKMIEDEDLDDFFEIHSSEIIYRYIPGKAKKNIKTVRNMIGHYSRDFNKKKMIFLGIYLKNPIQKMVGIVEIFDINKNINMVTVGYRLNENYWGKGISTRALKHLVNFLFSQIKVNRIQAFVMTENTRSGQVLKRNNFVYEGTIRKGQVWKDKGLVDLDLYSLLYDDYDS